MTRRSRFAAFICSLLFSVGSNAYAGIVFFDDFDGGQSSDPGVSGTFSGAAVTTSVEGYSGLGSGGNVFANDFLINGSAGNPAPATVLTLTGLPNHSSVNLDFLLAIIDTWDGTNFPPDQAQAPDYLNIRLDGNLIFSESFANADAATGQTYAPPAGVELANNLQLGFRTSNINDLDDAYDMGLDTQFDFIPHTSSTLTIEWFASGTGWTGGIGTDESWAIENVQISINPVPEPMSALLVLPAIVLIPWWARRQVTQTT